ELVVMSFPLPDQADLGGLTSAEREIVVLVLRGLSSQAIADRRATSVRTVANQLASIFKKLGVSGRGELTAALASRGE
ncbi:partial Putative HTH-type transcriptional regulator, partial [uncultured bacterium]